MTTDIIPASSPGSPNRHSMLPKYAKDTERAYVGEPWDKQPRETALAYKRFCMYRDLDPEERSVAEVARRVGRIAAGINKQALTHRWVERAEAYDVYLAAKKRRRLERRRLDVAEKHADQMEDALTVLSGPATELAKRLREQAEKDGLTIIEQMDDVSLLKLASSFSKDLPGLQKAQRDALDTGGSVVVPAAKIKAKGSVLRKLIENEGMRAMVEKMTLEVEEDVPVEEESDAG